MKRYYCTYFDRNYLHRALALISSLTVQSADFHLYVICLDEMSRVLLRALRIPNLTLIPLHEIEANDSALAAARQNRSVVEYYWTITPTIILRLLERNPEIDILTYLDADLYFFSSPEPIFEEMTLGSVYIHEHRFSADVLEKAVTSGRFNVGLMCFRRNIQGLEVLHWWRERCNEWCYARAEDGKFGDQAYLNDWPTRFEGVVVSQHQGVGVAPWNQGQWTFSSSAGGVPQVNGKPIIFYHFHNFRILTPQVVVPIISPEYPVTIEILKLCVLPYMDALWRAIGRVAQIYPQFVCGFWQSKNGAPGLGGEHTFIVASEALSHFDSISLPHRRIQLDSRWTCFASASQTKQAFLPGSA